MQNRPDARSESLVLYEPLYYVMHIKSEWEEAKVNTRSYCGRPSA